jgi:nucleoside-diphosphate-sugar epimerase
MDVSLVYGDVTQPTSLLDPISQASLVYHLAGQMRALRSKSFLEVNVEGTANVVEACARCASPPALVFVSSIAAAGPSREDHPLLESEPPEPVSWYGRSKLLAEQRAREFAGEVPITVLRPPIVFGEYEQDLYRMFKLVASGWHLVPTHPQQRYSLIHAQDLATCLILAAGDGERLAPRGSPQEAGGQGVYYAAYEHHPTYTQLGRLVAEALGREKIRVVSLPNGLTWLIAGIYELVARVRNKPDILNFDKAREASAGSWTCSPKKIQQQLGFTPPNSLQDRLRQTAAWYRSQGWL